MLLKSVHIENFRSIKNETLYCDDLTALVGANDVGKSTFLHAIKLFQDESPKIIKEDFYNDDTENKIIIYVTFYDLNDIVQTRFHKYIHDGNFIIKRIFEWNEDGANSNFYSCVNHYSEFLPFFNAPSKSLAQAEYNKLHDKYPAEFPSCRGSDNAQKILEQWEQKNPDKCNLYDHKESFSFVDSGNLGDFIKFLFIPAVRDATEDAHEGKNSALTHLIDLIIRKNLEEMDVTKKFRVNTKKSHDKIIAKSQPKLKEIENETTNILAQFFPNFQIILSLRPLENISIPLQAEVNIKEDHYQHAVSRTGHGLQRAFIITMLQYLALKESNNIEEPNKTITRFPTLVVLIEEPELYQHPNKQRRMSQIFLSIVKENKSSSQQKTQILYSTHSPQFVGIDRLHQIRILRKISQNYKKPSITKICGTSLKNILDEMSFLTQSSRYNIPRLESSLRTIMTPWLNEGFFADLVVLVEGEGEYAAIVGIAKSMGIIFEDLGISVIPCQGKGNLLKPAIIFRQFGIPTYVIWDSDKPNGNIQENHRLLRFVGKKPKDWPAYVCKDFACFKNNIECTIKETIGESFFEQYLDESKKKFNMSTDDAKKKPHVISMIIDKAKANNISCVVLENIIKNIIKLRKKKI